MTDDMTDDKKKRMIEKDIEEQRAFFRSMQPSAGALIDLVNALGAAGLTCTVDDYGTIFIKFSVLTIGIDARPTYCDRGRWKVLCESSDTRIANVDFSDGFPRYYFNDEALVMEMLSFREARMRHINKQ